MSIEAHRWALAQRTRSATTQCVLYVLANAADPEGVAFRWWKRREHWWPYLVDRTRVKRATLFGVIKEFEEVGLLSRETVPSEEGGRPMFCLVLHLDNYVDWDDEAGAYRRLGAEAEASPSPEVPSTTWTEETERGGTQTFVPSSTWTEPVAEGDPEDDASPAGGLIESSRWTPSIESACKSPGKESPPTPSLPAARPQGQPKEGKATSTEPIGFRSCFEAYPDWQVMDRAKALAAYVELATADRRLLADAVPEHAIKLRRLNRKPKNFHLWVRQRGFEAYAPGVGTPGPLVFVEEATEPWKAWCAFYAVAFATTPRIPAHNAAHGPGGKRGAWVRSEWPPGGDGWLVPHGRWGFVEEFTANFNRWRERVFEVVNRMPLLEHANAPRGAWLVARNHEGWAKQHLPLRGLVVPSEWPPAKTERKTGADPPEAQLTEEDSEALANL